MCARQAKACGPRVFTYGFLAILLAAAGPAAADDDEDDDDFGIRIASILSKPGGQTYGRWAVEWWQWGLGVPAAANPIADETGANCAQRQVDDTWFLAGSFGTDPIVRECTVPKGKALFFPLINNALFAFLNDPPEERTEEFLRAQAKCTEPLVGFAEIDNVKLTARQLRRFTTGPSGSQSPLFNVQLPPGNVAGAGEDDIPELVLSPSAEDGFYLYIEPLSPGEHRIRWFVKGCRPGRLQDITYHLTVAASDSDHDDDDDD
ncbi:MAG: hypothetical protein QNJ30_04480 [Kiloniellales bacterium]|nr:hypothetical protein [Kiloniellales bacterium]